MDYALDIDVRTNSVRVEVLAQDAPALHARGTDLPPSAEIVIVDALPTAAVQLYGGLELSTCTSGLTIYKNATSNRGITTAGHCPNNQTHGIYALTYQGDEVSSGSHDEQSHKYAGASYPNRVYDGVSPFLYRAITSKKSRNNQNVGDFVCKYGKTTFYGCGYIVSKAAGTCGHLGPGNNTSIKVDSDPNGTGYDLAEGGDSGGPYFINGTALGTTTCQQGYDGIYVATNYIESGLGATILTSP